MIKKIVLVILLVIALIVILISAYWVIENIHNYSPEMW